GGTITNGVINAATTGTYFTVNSGILDGVTISANTKAAVNGLATLTVKNGLTVNGTLTLKDPGYRDFHTNVNFQGSQHLSGTGQVVLGEKAAQLYASQTNSTLTIDSAITVRGQGFVGLRNTGVLINQGTIMGDTGRTLTTVLSQNQGKLQSTSGSLVVGNLTNSGTITTTDSV